jgi:hypothetical protein
MKVSETCKHHFSYKMFSPQNNMYWCKGNVVVMTHANMIEIVLGLQRTVEQGLWCDLQGDLHI